MEILVFLDGDPSFFRLRFKFLRTEIQTSSGGDTRFSEQRSKPPQAACLLQFFRVAWSKKEVSTVDITLKRLFLTNNQTKHINMYSKLAQNAAISSS